MKKITVTACTKAYDQDKDQRRKKTRNKKGQHDQKCLSYFFLPFDRSLLDVVMTRWALMPVPSPDLISKSFENFHIRQTKYHKSCHDSCDGEEKLVF